MRSMLLGMAALTMTVGMMAQSAPENGNPVDEHTEAAIHAKTQTLLGKAKASPEGLALEVLERYPGHFSELVVRVKDGQAEVHANYNDVFVVLEGEGNVMTGGTVVDPKPTAPGETRGARVEGGTPHLLHKGDILHIAPGIPHQARVSAGKTFTYFVVKVAAPKQ
jgi:mannose-6-phosphate isomerase-like protein (cupin superfamily)